MGLAGQVGIVLRVGKLSLWLTAAALALGLVLLVVSIERIKEVGDLAITKTAETVSEAADGTCVWTIDFEIENRTDEVVTIRSTRAAIQRSSPVSGQIIEDETGPADETLGPHEVTDVRLVFALNGCVDDPGEIKHDLLKVLYRLPGTGNRLETLAF